MSLFYCSSMPSSEKSFIDMLYSQLFEGFENEAQIRSRSGIYYRLSLEELCPMIHPTATMCGAPLCMYLRWGRKSQAIFVVLVAEGLFFTACRGT